MQTRSYAPVTIEPSRDYLTAYAEKEVRERLQRATPAADRYIVAAPTEPAETTRVVQKWVNLIPRTGIAALVAHCQFQCHTVRCLLAGLPQLDYLEQQLSEDIQVVLLASM